MNKMNPLFRMLSVVAALVAAGAAGCATTSSSGAGPRADACAFPAEHGSGPSQLRAPAAGQPATPPASGRTGGRGNLGADRQASPQRPGAVSARIARAAQGAQVAACMTGMAQVGDGGWARY